jgi:hypothetical protein
MRVSCGEENGKEKAKQEAVSKELKSLEGTWERVSVAAGGGFRQSARGSVAD